MKKQPCGPSQWKRWCGHDLSGGGISVRARSAGISEADYEERERAALADLESAAAADDAARIAVERKGAK